MNLNAHNEQAAMVLNQTMIRLALAPCFFT